jgi:hypothetical protein
MTVKRNPRFGKSGGVVGGGGGGGGGAPARAPPQNPPLFPNLDYASGLSIVTSFSW